MLFYKLSYERMLCWEKTRGIFLEAAWRKSMWSFAGAMRERTRDIWKEYNTTDSGWCSSMGSSCRSSMGFLADLCKEDHLLWLHRKKCTKELLGIFLWLLATSVDSCRLWLIGRALWFLLNPIATVDFEISECIGLPLRICAWCKASGLDFWQ